MKILVMSDSHGNLKNVQKIVDKYGINTQIIVHCGDAPGEETTWLTEYCTNATVVCVRGNCDFMSCGRREIETINIENKNIMVTHGHLFQAKYGLTNLSYAAQERGADIVFFGHTHIPTDETIGNVRLINPGSCSYYHPTCAVVEIDSKGNLLVNHLNVPK